jgi:hypothetical protein
MKSVDVEKMQPKNKWINVGILLVILCSFLVFAISIVPLVSGGEETSVNVKFEILTGSGTQDYFTGDCFWYNITLTDSGTTDINATFTVTVLNTTGGILPQVETYQEYLKPNDTTTLYPNYTRLGRDEVYIYFMDTVGTYTIELTCDKPMTFYRYYETGLYTVEHNLSHLGIDAMPSYQKLQNDRWNQFLKDNEAYMNEVQAYNAQSKLETTKVEQLSKMSVIIAGISILMNVIALPKTRRKEFKAFIVCFLLVLIAVMIFLLFIL